MGKGIDIIKYLDKNSIIYYFVTRHHNSSDFYIGIDLKNNIILFFKSNDFSEPIATINPLSENALSNIIPGINQLDSNMAIIQAYKALKFNKYPEYIGIQS